MATTKIQWARLSLGMYYSRDWRYALEKHDTGWLISERSIGKHVEPTLNEAKRWAQQFHDGEVRAG
jgi:hypothetical protein